MLALLSPSKTLAEKPDARPIEPTKPALLKQSEALIDVLKPKDEKDLGNLMGISPKLAELNVKRYQEWKTPFTKSNSNPAILMFKGDVYDGLDIDSVDDKDLEYLQEHVAILSGLYGLLKPFDLMQPYRLEMGTKLKNPKGKNLYEFWGDQVTEQINKQLDKADQKIVLNLASNEYFKAVKPKNLNGELITVDFKENKGGKFKTIGLFAKKARGMFARFLVEEKPKTIEDLKAFNTDGYAFNAELSDDKTLTFTR